MSAADGLVLGVDASTSRTSVALVRGSQVLSQHDWQSARGDVHPLLQATEHILATHHYCWQDLSLFAVGMGPGNYTGLRVSLAAVQALALPGGQPVRGICSATALLVDGMRRHPDAPAVVAVGDARRNHLWLYQANKGESPAAATAAMIPRDALASLPLPPGSTFLSPDYERLLQQQVRLPEGCNWQSGDASPHAADVARIAIASPQKDCTAEILYVHPPVFTAPSFPPAHN